MMFKKMIINLTNNLESLLDFVHLLDSYLHEKREEAMRLHAPSFGPVLLAMQKVVALPEEVMVKLPPEDIFKERIRQRLSLDVNIEVLELDGVRRASIEVSGEGGEKFDDAMKALMRAYGRIKLLYNSSLMNLVSIVELFFAELLHEYFVMVPEVIETKEKVFSFEDLKSFASIADAKEHYRNSRIEEILYGSFPDWISFLKKSPKLSMSYLDSDLDLLTETFQRRNLVVHNGGRVNSIYLSKVAANLTEKLSVGDILDTNRVYLNDRIDLFERNCLLIAAEFWKKLAPQDKNRDNLLSDIVYRHLVGQRWLLSESLSLFILQDKSVSERLSCTAKLNYWLSKKRQGQWSSIEDEVNSTDFSAKGLRFRVGHAALRGVNDDFFDLIPKALQAEEISVNEINIYPIFEEIRQDPRFDQYRLSDSEAAASLITSIDSIEAQEEEPIVSSSNDTSAVPEPSIDSQPQEADT
jgi:hypothetical protein